MILPVHLLDTALKHAFRKAQTEAEYAASRDAATQRQQNAGGSKAGFSARAAPKPWTAEVRISSFRLLIFSDFVYVLCLWMTYWQIRNAVF